MIRPAPPVDGRARRRGDEGDVEVFVADEQDAHPVDVARWEALARSVLAAEGVSGDAELAAYLAVTDVALSRIAKRVEAAEA